LSTKDELVKVCTILFNPLCNCLQENLFLHNELSTLTKTLDEAYAELCGKQQHLALHQAAQAGKIATVKALIYCGANKDERSEGETPLHLAAQYGQEATVEVLISLGANKEGIKKHSTHFRVI
jgi:ankyrin repeat protein